MKSDAIHTFEDFQWDCKEWGYHRGPTGCGNTSLMLFGIVEELGELAHVELKSAQSIRHSPEELDDMGKDAVGDLLVFLAQYCTTKGWGMEECANIALEEIWQRDWQKYPRNGKTE